MTTNQTIEGVPRELLEWVLRVTGVVTFSTDPHVKELRALLDEPTPRAEFKKVEMAHVMNALEDVRGKPVLTSNQCHDLAKALNDRLLSPLQLLAMPAEYLAAAQPQGEPVSEIVANWSDWSMVSVRVDGRVRTYVETGKHEQPAPVKSEFSTPDCPDCACIQDGNCLCTPSKPAAQTQSAPALMVLAEARTWLGDGLNSDGLAQEYWTPAYAALIERIDATLRNTK